MLKTTTSAIALTALLTAGALAQTTETNTTTTTVPLQTTTEGAADAATDAASDAATATGEAVENAGDAVEAVAEDATEAAGEAVETTGEAVEATGEAVTDAASDAATATGEAVENAGDAVEQAGDAVEESTDQMATDAPAADAEVTITETDATTTETEMTTTETEVPVTDTEASDTETVVVTEGEAPAEGTPVAGQMFEQSADSFLASTLIGTNVQSVDGDNIGEVDDLVLGSNGSVEGVVIGVGGFLGLGEKDVAVQFDAITVAQDPETREISFVLNSTEEELEAAPEFRTQDEIIAEQQAAQPTVIETAPVDPNAAPATNN